MTYINCTSRECELKPSTGFMFKATKKCVSCEFAKVRDPASSWRWVPYRGKLRNDSETM